MTRTGLARLMAQTDLSLLLARFPGWICDDLLKGWTACEVLRPEVSPYGAVIVRVLIRRGHEKLRVRWTLSHATRAELLARAAPGGWA